MPTRTPIDTAFLQRVIALLLSLAGLAERASAAPWLVRFVVLAILRRGEIAARNLVIGEAHDAGIPVWMPPDLLERGSEPIDALELGLCFRMLAMALSAVLALICREESLAAATHLMSRRPNLLPAWRGFVSLQVHDTS